jgi:cytochrome c oxidase subunit 2
MNRFWSILFFLVPVLAIGTFALNQFSIWPLQDVWFGKSFSTAGETIDSIFNGIHLLAAVILIGTVMALGWAIWKFDHRRYPEGSKATYFSHNTKLELIWTAIPALILLVLAFAQMNSWSENKMQRPTTEVNGQSVVTPPTVLVKAKQFGWEFYYPGADGVLETEDDLYIENLMVVPVGTDVIMQLESRDVIHSFFVSDLRLKQDIVPGMVQYAWFNANQTGDLEILCTELCGWGHYKMKAQLRIVPQAEFDMWAQELQDQHYPRVATTDTAGSSEVSLVESPQ